MSKYLDLFAGIGGLTLGTKSIHLVFGEVQVLDGSIHNSYGGGAIKSTNNIMSFTSPEFGEIRTAGTPDNPLFCLADVCRALGIKNASDCKSRLNQKGVVITDTPTIGGVQQMVFVTEGNLYKCIFMSRKKSAAVFQDWVSDDILPSIRKTGGYILTNGTETNEELMARAMIVAQDTLRRRNERIQQLEDQNRYQLNVIEQKQIQLDESKKWWSVKRWAKVMHVSWKSVKWRILKKLSQENGYEVRKIFDANYGEVNTYHIDVFNMYARSVGMSTIMVQ